MVQFIFFALFVITLIAGAFTYFTPPQKTIDPLGFMMDSAGITSEDSLNNNKSQAVNVTMTNGLVQIHRQIDALALEQNKFLDTIHDQQRVLENTARDAADVFQEAETAADAGTADILQLKALAKQMQDQQRLLVAHGQELIAMNDEMAKNRQWVSDQIDLANINTDTSLRLLHQHYTMLKDQASDFFDQVSQHNQAVRDQMDKMQDQLHGLVNNASFASSMQRQNTKEHIGRMLRNERENMMKLADAEQRSKELMKNVQENFEESNQLLNDLTQKTQDKIDDERQKAQDQQYMLKQRVADEMQRVKDQQDR